jgi:polyphosphate kinase
MDMYGILDDFNFEFSSGDLDQKWLLFGAPMKIIGVMPFRITRNANIARDEDDAGDEDKEEEEREEEEEETRATKNSTTSSCPSRIAK